jgi:hypothetical protein
MRGLEPPRFLGHSHLKAACMPVSPHPRACHVGQTSRFFPTISLQGSATPVNIKLAAQGALPLKFQKNLEIISEFSFRILVFVPGGRFELPFPCGNNVLNVARLPVSPPGHVVYYSKINIQNFDIGLFAD